MGDVLFLAHRIPFPPDRGDKIRANNILNYIAGFAPVHVGCFWETGADRDAGAELAALAKSHYLVRRSKPLALAGAEAVLFGKPVSLTAFHSRRLAQWVKQTILQHNIETVFVFSGQMGQYIPDDFAGQVIVDLCDVDSVKFEDYANAGERVWLNRRESESLRQEEERLARRSDTTFLISENERDVLLGRLSNACDTRIRPMGNGIDSVFFDPCVVTPHAEIAARIGPHLVFTGQMDYRPNEAAAIWTVEEFLPAARERIPGLEFHIVGRNPTPALLSRKDAPGVTVWGEVPDVRPFLAAADLGFVPLSIARGVQNKVLEAMAMELPVLLTPQAATGIAAEDGKDWLVAPLESSSLLNRLETVLSDTGTRQKVAKSAREFVLEHHSWPAMLSPLKELIGPRPGACDAA